VLHFFLTPSNFCRASLSYVWVSYKRLKGCSVKHLIPSERIEKRILLMRGQKVMLSADLAELYEVEPRILIQAAKRNIERFPADFMFQLNFQEVRALRSQSVILKRGQHIKYRPYAFTEHGILMLSSVLQSRRAIQVDIEIMRAFVRLRKMIASNKKLAKRLDELEKKYDSQFKVVFDAIRELMTPPASLLPSQPRIGFRALPPSAGSYSF
jgi:hypothetical protein